MPLVDARLTPLSSLVSGLDLLLSQDIADDAVYCAVVAKRLQRALEGRWLPKEARRSSPNSYHRHLLHEDPAGRFSIGSFVCRTGRFGDCGRLTTKYRVQGTAYRGSSKESALLCTLYPVPLSDSQPPQHRRVPLPYGEQFVT